MFGEDALRDSRPAGYGINKLPHSGACVSRGARSFGVCTSKNPSKARCLVPPAYRITVATDYGGSERERFRRNFLPKPADSRDSAVLGTDQDWHFRDVRRTQPVGHRPMQAEGDRATVGGNCDLDPLVQANDRTDDRRAKTVAWPQYTGSQAMSFAAVKD